MDPKRFEPSLLRVRDYDFAHRVDPSDSTTRDIRNIRMDREVHNNKMERINAELHDRERVMRTLERTDTPILTEMQIYHNYVRPHEALSGKTPA